MANKNNHLMDLLLALGILILIGFIFWGYHIPSLGLYWDDWAWIRRWEALGVSSYWMYD